MDERERQNILIQGLLPDGECFNLITHKQIAVGDLKELIFIQKLIPPAGYYLTANGVCLEDSDGIGTSVQNCFTVLQAHQLLLGGKGGFGTLIRAMGTQINKGSRKGACRDLSGRRMRDVDAEKKLAKWMTEEPERRKKCREAKKKKQEQRRSEPKHYFNDSTYMDQIHSTEKEIDTALKQGMHAVADTKGTKRKLIESPDSSGKKKQKIWVGVEDSSDEFSDSDIESGKELVSKYDTDRGESSQAASTLDDGVKYTDAETEVIPEAYTKSEILEEGCSKEDKSEDCAATDTKSEDSPATDAKSEDSPATDTKSEDSPVTTKSEHKISTQVPLKMLNVEDYGTFEELMEAGGDHLKYTLKSMGLKCGGTVRERAQRLFSTKGKSEEEIDSSLYVRKTKRK